MTIKGCLERRALDGPRILTQGEVPSPELGAVFAQGSIVTRQEFFARLLAEGRHLRAILAGVLALLLEALAAIALFLLAHGLPTLTQDPGARAAAGSI